MDYTYHGSNVVVQITVRDLKIPAGISAYPSSARSSFILHTRGRIWGFLLLLRIINMKIAETSEAMYV